MPEREHSEMQVSEHWGDRPHQPDSSLKKLIPYWLIAEGDRTNAIATVTFCLGREVDI